MNEREPDKTRADGRKAVGVYDRPAGADRARNIRRWLVPVAVLVVVVAVVLLFVNR